MPQNSSSNQSHQEFAEDEGPDDQDGAENEEKAGFKEKLEEIDEILETLQQGDLELEESLDLYETSIGLLRECKEILNQSEEKIELLKEEGEEILTEPFEPQPDEEADRE